jgi:hypothetical protein
VSQCIEHLTVAHGLVTGATVGYPPVFILDPEPGEDGLTVPASTQSGGAGGGLTAAQVMARVLGGF